ncbi:MAG: putative RNA 2'-phosphotransferase [Candidatus Thorarchaeota archaeon]|nr:MAG: putative RNA 2'-phosphotransferase [Candidatus Thorarchaeota archaeon]
MINREKLSRYLSYLLRHHPEKADLEIDRLGGWVSVEKLLAHLNISLEDLKEIVAKDKKRRYSFEGDKFERIRANQGHSVDVDLELRKVIPPDILYHGTAFRHLPEIRNEGLQSMGRHHVHLSETYEDALKVGNRHGRPVVIVIDSASMHRDGIEFYISENNVYLIEQVPPKYFLEIKS